jgi:hypothetical protein
MRIIGGHDYYDSALAYGQDNDVVFLREHTEISDDQCPLYNGFRGDILVGHYWRSPHLSIRDSARGVIDLHLLPVSIYVAGVHHGGIKVIERDTGIKVEVFWDYEKFESWVTTQEFTSKENCMAASNAIKMNSRSSSAMVYSSCVVK